MSVKIKKIPSEVFSAGTAFFACELLEVFVWKKTTQTFLLKERDFVALLSFHIRN